MRVAYTIRGMGVFFHYEYRIATAKWIRYNNGPVDKGGEYVRSMVK